MQSVVIDSLSKSNGILLLESCEILEIKLKLSYIVHNFNIPRQHFTQVLCSDQLEQHYTFSYSKWYKKCKNVDIFNCELIGLF